MRPGLRLVLARVLAVGCFVALVGGPMPAAHAADVLIVKTVPATPGARVSAEGTIAVADNHGVARLPVSNWDLIDTRFHVLDTRVGEDRKVVIDRVVGKPSDGRSGRPITVGLRTQRLIHWNFVDRGGQEMPTSRLSLLEMRSNAGEIATFEGADLERPAWLAAGRTQQTPKGLVNKEQYWSVTRVVVDGAEVVNSSQQVFFPDQTQDWTIGLLFYRLGITGRDLLFGGAAGKGVELYMPDGELVRVPFDGQGRALFPSLPRGTYDVRVYGSGASFTRPLSISRDQEVDIEVITPLDIGLVVTTIVLVMLSLVLIGRRHKLPKPRMPKPRMPKPRLRRGASAAAAVALVAGSLLVGAPAPRAVADTRGPGADAPAYAYFYIWYQPTSWLRAKADYPLLGRYSSDDQVVMGRQVQMAQAAGLNGFIVSWKHSNTLDQRLATLVRIATAHDFELSVVYQGLDFERHPLPVATIIKDLQRFADNYAGAAPFSRFGKPAVAITGTELFEVADLAKIRAAVGDRLLLLATAKSVDDYRRVSSVVDGDAYYWSSAHPGPDWYTQRLVDLGAAVHADDNGLWFAPAAPGFDARLIGGTQVIPRADGETLRLGVAAARASQPDVLAIISWNEYSENSFVEPSERLGTSSLKTLADLLGGTVDVPSSATAPSGVHHRSGLTGWGALITLLLLFAILNFVVIILRPFSRHPSEDGASGGRHVDRSVDSELTTS